MTEWLDARRSDIRMSFMLCALWSFGISNGAEPASYSEPEILTDFYRIAVSGGYITKFDPLVSLNNVGRVAYIANRTGGQSVFSGAPFSNPVVASFVNPAGNRRYGFAQISDNGSIVADEAVSISPPAYLIRIWTGGMSSTATFPGGTGFAPRAMLDDLGGFVFRDPSSRIFYYTKTGPTALIASPSIGFGNLGRSPGLSDDGKASVFFGNFDDDADGPGTVQPGIFIRFRDSSGGWTVSPRRLAGSASNATFDPGEAVWTNLGSGGTKGNVIPSSPADYKIVRIRSFLPDGAISGLTQGPVRMLLTAPNGKRFGIDASTGTRYSEIPGSYYEPIVPILDGETDLSEEQIRSHAATADYEAYVENVSDGEFKVELFGTSAGMFAAQLAFHSGSGRTTRFDLADSIRPGEKRSHSIQMTNSALVPQILLNPQSQNAGRGGAVSFSCAAQGTDPLSFQWLRGLEPLKDSERVFGAQSSILTITQLQNDDEGAYTLRVRNAAGSATSIAATLSLAQLGQSFGQWASAHGLDAGQDGVGGDPDQDGLPNLVEFALGLDPKVSSQFPIVTSLREGRVSLIYERSKMAQGISIISEASRDLTRWTTDGVVVLKLNEPASVETWSASIPVIESAHFLRLRISVP
jgi:hypothetical protein